MSRLTAKEVFARLKSRASKVGDCWLYPQKARYARTKLNGETRGVHQVAWIANFGEIPDGLCVCHTCDQPKCINPKHLWLGTNQENTADKVTKDRQAKGSRVSWKYSNLTAIDVQEIRELYTDGIPPRIIKRLYPVGKANFWNLVKRESWRHV